MARPKKPRVKMKRRFGMLPEGVSIRKEKRMTRKKSDYGRRLEEKQKLKFIYGIMERQLERYVREARKTRRDPSEVILQILETRLDNVVYRLGFAKTREQARQIVNHGHIKVNGRKVDIPSYNMTPGEEIMLDEKMMGNLQVQESIKEKKVEDIPLWLKREGNKGVVNYFPGKEHLRQDINMSYIIEFYS